MTAAAEVAEQSTKAERTFLISDNQIFNPLSGLLIRPSGSPLSHLAGCVHATSDRYILTTIFLHKRSTIRRLLPTHRRISQLPLPTSRTTHSQLALTTLLPL